MVKIAFIETDSPEDWNIIEHDDPALAILDHFKGDQLPENTRIYDEISFATSNDITPHSAEELSALREHEGPLYVKSYPGDPVTVIAVVSAIIAVASIVLVATLPTPTATARNTQSESPNNALSSRSNRPRPNARIPDPYGTVRSTPDLLSTYSVYVSHQEIEFSYMCIGRGEYLIDAEDVYDGDTPILDIDGAAVSIYDPFTSPNSGDAPYLQIGEGIPDDVYIVFKSNAVNGQTLIAANDANIRGRRNIAATVSGFITTEDGGHVFTDQFAVNDEVEVVGGGYTEGGSTGTVTTTISTRFHFNGNIDAEVTGEFSSYSAGDEISISSAVFYETVTRLIENRGGDEFSFEPNPQQPQYEDVVIAINLNGVYEIQSISGDTITLVSPSSVNSNWNKIDEVSGDVTSYKDVDFQSATVGLSVDLSGTYTVSAVTTSTLTFSNPNNENDGWADVSNLEFGVTAGYSPSIYRNDDNWLGPFVIADPVEIVVANLTANQGLFKDDGEDQRSTTVRIQIEVTPIDINGDPSGAVISQTGTVVGSKDSRGLRALTMKIPMASLTRVSVRARRVTLLDLNFEGSVVDEIKFKALYGMRKPDDDEYGNVMTVHSKTRATEGALSVKERKLNMIVTRKVPLWISGETFTPPQPTTYAADIFTAICLDPEIGGLDLSEIDLASIYGSIATVRDYFGGTNYASFSYTFDNDNVSLQDSLQLVSKAVFCQDYRQADKIRLTPNIATDDSRILFNHRNKIPLSEERTDRFGILDDIDGVEVEWVDPKDDSLTIFYIPEDRTATSPRKIETIGIRNEDQAFAFTWRAWLRLQHENGGTEFQATQEAELLVPTNRILVADNTQNIVQDGEIKSQTGLVLNTSQELIFEEGSDYWAHVQHIDGTIEPIPVTPGPEPDSMTLSRAPKAPLSLDDDNFAKATYLLTDDATGRHSAYQVGLISAGRGGTATVSATRYSGIYYLNDGLLFWLRDGLTDYGPRRLSFTAGSVVDATDADRGEVISAPSGASLEAPVQVLDDSFSIALWIKRSSGSGRVFGTASEEMSLSLGSGGEVTFKSAAADLVGGSIALDEWTHIVASIDSEAGVGSVYIDGILSVSGAVTSQGSGLLYFISDNSSAENYDDIRYYARPLSLEDARSLYNLTRRL